MKSAQEKRKLIGKKIKFAQEKKKTDQEKN